MDLHDRLGSGLDPASLYAILRLRSAVFVVEQACAYLDLDGQDLLPGVRHCWLEEAGHVRAYLRIRPDATGVTWISRVCTEAGARGRGLAARLFDHALATTTGALRLKAQAHLTTWYSHFGFATVGDVFDEDGIAHVAMALDR